MPAPFKPIKLSENTWVDIVAAAQSQNGDDLTGMDLLIQCQCTRGHRQVNGGDDAPETLLDGWTAQLGDLVAAPLSETDDKIWCLGSGNVVVAMDPDA